MTTSDVVGSLLAESGMAGDATLTAVLTDLRDQAAGPPPEPSPQLAALLVGDGPAATEVLPAPVVPLTRRRRAAVGVSAVVLAAVASTGVAAAANQLPSGAQRLAAQLSDHFLPFNFPLPREAGPLTPGPPGPHGGGNPQHPDGPAAQGTAPPATLDPATATPSDHRAARHDGEHDGHRTRGTDDGHDGDGREGLETHHRDRDGSGAGDDAPSDGSERSGRTEGGYDDRGSDDGERSGSDDHGSGTSGGSGDGGSDGSDDGGSASGPGEGSGGGSDVPDVAGALPQ